MLMQQHLNPEREYGKICAKHPELNGLRYSSGRCKGCHHEGRQKHKTKREIYEQTPERKIRKKNNYHAWRNRPEFKEYRKIYIYQKRKNNITWRITQSLRRRLGKICENIGIGKAAPTLQLLGCSVGVFKRYIEAQFKPGMTWANRGKVWHMDHIKPCAFFDLTDKNQQRECFHYTNFQPLIIEENFHKNSRYNGMRHWYKKEK